MAFARVVCYLHVDNNENPVGPVKNVMTGPRGHLTGFYLPPEHSRPFPKRRRTSLFRRVELHFHVEPQTPDIISIGNLYDTRILPLHRITRSLREEIIQSVLRRHHILAAQADSCLTDWVVANPDVLIDVWNNTEFRHIDVIVWRSALGRLVGAIRDKAAISHIHVENDYNKPFELPLIDAMPQPVLRAPSMAGCPTTLSGLRDIRSED